MTVDPLVDKDVVIPGLTRDLTRNRSSKRLEIPAFAGMTVDPLVDKDVVIPGLTRDLTRKSSAHSDWRSRHSPG
jgi:hypothetical protein